MSLEPHPTTLHAPSPHRAQTKRIEGLSGETELRRASGGYWQVWPRPTPESQRALYGEQFYESDKSTYLADMAEERPYWDALWTIRRQMMEMFLLMGDDYVGHPEIGKACHKRRMNFERSLIESGHEAQLATLYRSLAQAGMGRTCGILAQKR
jgi:hypothetical protein